MKKTLKIALISFGSLIGLLLIVAILVPLLFKEQIKKAVDEAIAEKVDAEIVYKTEDVSLGIFRSFPNLTFGIENLTVRNNAPFKGDTLLHVGNFEFVINLMDFIKRGQISIKKIIVISPAIHLKTLKDGTSNYNIMKPSKEEPEEDTKSEPIQLALDLWKIENADITYEDSSIQTYVYIKNLNQTGNASLKNDVVNSILATDIQSLSASYGKIPYLSKHTLASKINIEIAKNYTLYTLRENNIKLNALELTATGMFEMMQDSSYKMDISLASVNNQFKDLLSMAPVIYKKNFDNIQTKGVLSFSAHIKGIYNERLHKNPSFNARLKVDDASFKYPSLPLPVKDIFIHVSIDNPDGVIGHTNALIDRFSLSVENDPLSVTGEVTGLKYYRLNSMGKFNLSNVKKIYPIEGMDLSGLLSFSLLSKGDVDLVKAGKYQTMQNSGTIEAKDMLIKTDSMPSVRISQAWVGLKDQAIEVRDLEMNVGRSDMRLAGKVNDYLDYLFTPKGILKGNFNLTSNYIDFNEWMPSSDSNASSSDKASSPKEAVSAEKVYLIPKNIDLSLNSSIQKISMMNMPIERLKGSIGIKDGIVKLNKTAFNLLQGDFLVSGDYNTANPKKVFANLDLDIKNISVQESYKTFNTVKKLAPIAENIIGKAGLNMKIYTEIGDGYAPIYSSINGAGTVRTQDIGLTGFKPINALSDLTKIKEFKDPKFAPGKLDFSIENGKVTTKPFDLNIANIKTNISGSATLEGVVDYEMKANIPAKLADDYLKQLLGPEFAQYSFVETIPVSIYFRGKYNSIKPSIVPDKQKLKNALGSQVKQKTEEVKNTLISGAQSTLKSIIDTSDKRSGKEKIDNAIQEGKKKILNLFGKPSK